MEAAITFKIWESKKKKIGGIHSHMGYKEIDLLMN